MKDLPESDDGIAQWCRDLFVAKVNVMYVLVFPLFSYWQQYLVKI